MAGTLILSTATVRTTIWSTILVTVPAATTNSHNQPFTTSSVPQETYVPTSASSDSPSASAHSSSSICPPPATSQPTSSAWTALPTVVTPTSDYGLPPVVLVTATPTPALSSSNNATASAMSSRNPQQKRAIIGGLSGTIAALIFVGLLICLVLRLRRKKHDSDLSSLTEKAEPRPPLARKLTGLVTVIPVAGRAGKGSPGSTQVRPTSLLPVTVDEDHRIIRMSTRHWPRPFVPGAGEGYRDSAPYGQLRVVNPDASRPSTPRKSSETANSFMRKQREALAAFVFTYSRPQSISKRESHPLSQDVPTITVVDPTLSRECVAGYASTPSFRSYLSLVSSQYVPSHSPGDPFTVSPGQIEKQLPALPHERSRPADLDNAAAAAIKPWSSLSSLLHPFRSRSNPASSQPATKVRRLSHFSVSTNGSKTSRLSDPFDLDRPSMRGSTPTRPGHELHREGHAPGWILYEGT